MAKVNVYIPDGLLLELEEYAAERGLSRSGVVQEAAATYLASAKRERRRAAREERVLGALERMRELGGAIEPGFDGTARIRADRDRDSGR